jgi:hypothetical protein
MESEENLTKWLSDESSTQASVVTILRHYLTIEEAIQIFQQFRSKHWHNNRQVLWSGMLRENAQKWADEHEMQTLTTAMGPLMLPEHPLCLQSKKTAHAWSQYIHGASAIFAWHIARGETVTVLSPPPPDRFNPSGLTYYQVIEQPIIKGAIGEASVDRICLVHPMVKRAEDLSYQFWPDDNKLTWIKQFGLQLEPRKWRITGKREGKLKIKNMMGMHEDPPHSVITSKSTPSKKVRPQGFFTDISSSFFKIRGQSPIFIRRQNLLLDGCGLQLYHCMFNDSASCFF